MFHLQTANRPAGKHGNDQARAHINRGDFPAEKSVEQHQCDLVDHRRGNEKGKGHPERYGSAEKTDKKGHRRAGAKGGHNAEQRGQYIANRFTLAGKDPAGALRGKVGADEAHAKDHQDQEHEDFRGVVEEEFHRAGKMLCISQPRNVSGQQFHQMASQPAGNRRQTLVDNPPGHQQGDPDQEINERRFLGVSRGGVSAGIQFLTGQTNAAFSLVRSHSLSPFLKNLSHRLALKRLSKNNLHSFQPFFEPRRTRRARRNHFVSFSCFSW